MAQTLHGIAASSGISIGKVCLLRNGRIELPSPVPKLADEIAAEIQRFDAALELAQRHIASFIEREARSAASPYRHISSAQLYLLKDPQFGDDVRKNLEGSTTSADWGVVNTLSSYRAALSGASTGVEGSSWSDDLTGLGELLLRALNGLLPGDKRSWRNRPIIVTHDLPRADTGLLGIRHSRGLATEIGGRTSLSAVHARAIGIPAVVGVSGITDLVQTGDAILLDGLRGTVVVNPDEAQMSQYRERRARVLAIDGRMVQAARESARTTDGYEVPVRANLDLPSGLPYALQRGADGIGLLRTESLFGGGPPLPSEEHHYACYRRAVEQAAPHPVTVRTVDVDEEELRPGARPQQPGNRALGVRGIRYSLTQPHLFKEQLKGILRATAHGDVRILLPMVSTLAEIRHAKALITESREELVARGIECADAIRMGVMLEVPAAVVLADRLVHYVDFITIGTNDLIQYTMAADRTNPRLAHLYQPLHPAVLRMIGATAVAAHEASITVSACGEMAGTPEGVAILLGLGVDELSTGAAAIPLVKKTIRMLRVDELEELVKRAMSFTDAAKVHDYLHKSVRLPRTYDEEIASTQEADHTASPPPS